jgi:rhodanese-related sulfurtransferase
MCINNLVVALIINLLSVFVCFGDGIQSFPADSIQDQIVDHKKITYDIIILDVRTNLEVNGGIVASTNCKPYHLTWNTDEWTAKYNDLPKEVPIIIYCHSGARATSAATFLINNGYSKVAIIANGLMNYKGLLADSTNFKPWSELPQPSYTNSSNTIFFRSHQAIIVRTPDITQQKFNLMGQRIKPSIVDPNTPIFILERIGDTGNKRIIGLHHLIQSK